MSIIGAWGFEGQDLTRDGFVLTTGGVPTYDVEVPLLGASTRSLYFGSSIPGGNLRLPVSPASTDFWMHGNFVFGGNNSLNDYFEFGWFGGGVLAGWITRQDITNLLQIVVDGVVVATSVVAVPLDAWKRLHVHVDYQNSAAGFVRVYQDGDTVTPMVAFTGNTNPSAYGAISGIRLRGYGMNVDDIVVLDPNDGVAPTDVDDIAFTSIGLRVPNVDGTDTGFTATPGTGSDYEDIDEVPNSDAEFLRATAASVASTFGFEDATLGRPLAVKVKVRTVRSGTTAGVNIAVRQRLGPTVVDTADRPCPGDGDVHQIFNTDANGAAWTSTAFDNSEFGVVSKT